MPHILRSLRSGLLPTSVSGWRNIDSRHKKLPPNSFNAIRARQRRPRSDDFAALKRLLNLLLKQGVIPEPPRPSVTPADQLRNEFGSYLRQGRALASITVMPPPIHRRRIFGRPFRGWSARSVHTLQLRHNRICTTSCGLDQKQTGPVADDRTAFVSAIRAISW